MEHPDYPIGTRVRVVSDLPGGYMLEGCTGMVIPETAPSWMMPPHVVSVVVDPDPECVAEGLAKPCGKIAGWACAPAELEVLQDGE